MEKVFNDGVAVLCESSENARGFPSKSNFVGF